ncbi:MAG: hypothetical protein Q8M03_06280, partial [Legionella sp.]|nr:hypothetical protein [Legionella sp.]
MLLKDILYYTKTTSALIYSNTPGTHISPEKLIAGLPPFLSADNTTHLLPKTLIIPQLDFSKINWRAHITLFHRLRKIKQSGHPIKQVASNLLIDLVNDDLLGMFLNLEPAPSLKICSSLLNISADELLICDENIIQLLINGDASDLEEFKPFKHIILREHPLSQELFEQLLREHGKTIETVEVMNCPNITDLQGFLLSNLVSLKVTPFRDVVTWISNTRDALQKNASRLETLILNMRTLDNKIINDISSLTNLRTLNLSHCPDFSEDLLGNIAFSELEQLSLNNSTIQITALQTLLQTYRKLKRIDLAECVFYGVGTLNGISLRKLKELNLSHSTLNIQSLKVLLQGAPNLKILKLSSSSNLYAIMFIEISLRELEELDVSDSTINIPSLRTLLQWTIKLRRLNLSRCKNIKEGTLNILLNKLEELNLSRSSINIPSLQTLLQESTKLKSLDLSYCKNLMSGTLKDISLSQLEVLNLSHSFIRIKSLQALLQRAPKLRLLNLSFCMCLQSEDSLDNIALNELEELNLEESNIDIVSLQPLLQGTSKLKSLNLSGYDDRDKGILTDISLSQLEKLDLSLSFLNIASLQTLLQRTPKLKILNLLGYSNSNEDTLKDIFLSELEELSLNRSSIDAVSLQSLLQGAFKLKNLKLDDYQDFDKDVLNAISSSHLETLSLSNTTINTTSLQALLQKSLALKSLNLTYCHNLHEGRLHGVSLGELEALYLKGSTISMASLQALLQGAPKITHLDLTNCENISDFHLQVLLQQYPSIKFIRYNNHEGHLRIPENTQSEPTQDQQQARPLDANTDVEKKTYQLEREFIAEPLPDVRMMRHECYQRMALNPAMTDRADPFLLINEEPHPVEGTILNAVKSAVPLIDAFKETTKTQSFTRLD